MSLRLSVLLFVALPVLFACGQEPSEAPPYCPAPYADVPWGTAVDGLALAVEFPKTAFAEGEGIRLTVRAKNVTDGPLKLSSFEDLMWWYRLRFENLGDGPDFAAARLELVDFAEPPDLTLGAGEVWTKEVDLAGDGRYLRIIENRKPGDDWDYRDHLPAGRWRATLAWDGGQKGRDGFWAGRVESRPVEVTIEAAP